MIILTYEDPRLKKSDFGAQYRDHDGNVGRKAMKDTVKMNLNDMHPNAMCIGLFVGGLHSHLIKFVPWIYKVNNICFTVLFLIFCGIQILQKILQYLSKAFMQ